MKINVEIEYMVNTIIEILDGKKKDEKELVEKCKEYQIKYIKIEDMSDPERILEDNDKCLEKLAITEKCQEKIGRLSLDDKSLTILKDLGKLLNKASLKEIKNLGSKDDKKLLVHYYMAGKHLEEGNIIEGCKSLEKGNKLKIKY
jgi:hypothetical protein